MSYTIKYNNFELIDIPQAMNASLNLNKGQDLTNSLEKGIYKQTQNGFVIVSTQIENSQSGKQAIEIVRQAVLSFFSKRTHRKPHLAMFEAIVYANKQLYLSAYQNENLKNKKISCLVVLIREKQVYYSYTGTNNLFILNSGRFERITPGKTRVEGDDLSETSYINSSVFNPNLKVSVCKQPFNPSTNDLIFICTDTYVNVSDTYIEETVTKEKKIEKIGIDLVKNALESMDKKTRQSFVLLKFNIQGGKYTLAGTFEYLYANFLGKIIAFVISVPVLIGLAILTIYLFYLLLI